jgi:preprotein translocase subunit SecD
MNIRNRLLIILALLAASAYALWPRTETELYRGAQGRFTEREVTRVPLKKGLDLQGGMHLALEIDQSRGVVTDKAEALERALKVVRTRIDEFGVAEPVVQKVGDDRIIVELPGIDDPERARDLVQRSAFLQFQITDETNALDKALPRIDAIVRKTSPDPDRRADTTRTDAITELFTPGADTGARRADTTGADTSGAARDTAGRTADTAASDSPSVAAGISSDGPFSRVLQPGQIPGEFLVAESDVATLNRYLEMPQVRAALPPGKVLRWGVEETSVGGKPYRPLYILDARPIITGESLTDARPNTDPIEGNIVQFTLNNVGGRRFRNATAKHVGDYMAIVLDDRVMGRPPVIQSAIGTRGQITMRGQPLQEAQDLALVLRAGALPVPLQVVEVRQIGASLGQDAIEQGVRAGILGVALVVLIMIVYYRFSGFLAVLGLIFYGVTTLAILAGFDAVLTLPGLAGFVLSIGMAVDANFLIFERIREELDHGRTTRVAIDEGFKHAWSAIVDSHVTTALTALILYQFGTGPVRGFAVALLAGLAASMVSAIFVVRTLFLLWLRRSRGAQPLSI